MLRARRIAILLAAALAAAGCGDDDDDRGNLKVEGGTNTAGETGTSAETTPTTETSAPTGPATATIGVRETEYELDPKNAKIARAGVVSFRVRNAGDVLHALEVEGPNGEQETEGIEPGATATLKVDLDRAGRYKWYCPIADHEERGMKGVITVAGGGSSRGDDRGGDRTTTEDDRGGGGRGGVSGGSGAGGY